MRGSGFFLWGIFQSGGSEDVMQLLEDSWSESRKSRRGCSLLCSPGGTEPGRMVLHQLDSIICKAGYKGRVFDV